MIILVFVFSTIFSLGYMAEIDSEPNSKRSTQTLQSSLPDSSGNFALYLSSESSEYANAVAPGAKTRTALTEAELEKLLYKYNQEPTSESTSGFGRNRRNKNIIRSLRMKGYEVEKLSGEHGVVYFVPLQAKKSNTDIPQLNQQSSLDLMTTPPTTPRTVTATTQKLIINSKIPTTPKWVIFLKYNSTSTQNDNPSSGVAADNTKAKPQKNTSHCPSISDFYNGIKSSWTELRDAHSLMDGLRFASISISNAFSTVATCLKTMLANVGKLLLPGLNPTEALLLKNDNIKQSKSKPLTLARADSSSKNHSREDILGQNLSKGSTNNGVEIRGNSFTVISKGEEHHKPTS